MRQPITVLLTILPDEADPTGLRGRAQVVTADSEHTFRSDGDLVRLLLQILYAETNISESEAGYHRLSKEE